MILAAMVHRKFKAKCNHQSITAHLVKVTELCYHTVELKQEGQHPLTGQCATNFRLLANQ